MKPSRLIKLASDLKPLYQDGVHFVVAFAVKQGRILRLGVNSYKTTDVINKDYVNKNGSKTAFRHAESNLIKKLRYVQKDKISIYVVRVSNQGHSRLSKPCANCRVLLEKAQFKSIYYSCSSGEFKKL